MVASRLMDSTKPKGQEAQRLVRLEALCNLATVQQHEALQG